MKIGRNDPCPCGGGLKYKRCCGVGDAPSAKIALSEPMPIAARHCGECSVCCEGWVKTQVLGHDIDTSHPCPYSSGHNCTIHETRPKDPCRIFFCGWVEANSRLPDWMQPNRCGVIVLTGRSSWRSRPVDVLVSAGRDPDKKLLNWFMQHSKAELRPFIYQSKEMWYGFGPREFQEEIAIKVIKGERLWT